MTPGRKTCPFRSALLVSCLIGSLSCSEAVEPAAVSRLDLADFEASFVEEFDSLDVSEWGCLSRWITHTPWGGDFGSARFLGPNEDSPFETNDGILKIAARNLEGDRWGSGMLAAWDACNSGFAQKYGYFEIRAKLPSTPGFWPAFWLMGVDTRQGSAEIDVFEFRTHDPSRFSLGLLKHPSREGEARQNRTTRHNVEAGSLSRDFNTYGVEVGRDFVTFYLNREEIWRTPTPAEFQQPMYPLVSLPADASQFTSSMPNEVVMEVDYVRIYQRKPIGF